MGLKKQPFKLLFLNLWVLNFMILLFWSPLSAAEKNGKHDTTRIDTLHNSKEEYMQLRGLESDKKDGNKALITTANALLFLPKTATAGLLYSVRFAPLLVDDSRFIERYDDFFYIYGKTVGWYPVLNISSGSRIGIGANLFVRNKSFSASVGGFFARQEFWTVRVNSNYSFLTGKAVWNLNLSGEVGVRNDLEYYGLGHDPRNDERNPFLRLSGQEFIMYSQRRPKLQFVLGVRPSSRWQFFYSTYYYKRTITNPAGANNFIVDSLFVNAPADRVTNGEAIIEQYYNELAFKFDTRKYTKEISPGIHLEGYAGLSLGVNDDRSRFARLGADFTFYIPTIRKNRLIVPRVVMDFVNNLNDNVPIPFTEYPRQPTFRGISTKSQLRSDEVSMVPSLEYQWPLTYNLGGHLFVDYLIVSDSFNRLTFNNSPYAIGFGIDLHSPDREMARLSLSGGSEGFRFSFTFGFTEHTTDRTKWK